MELDSLSSLVEKSTRPKSVQSTVHILKTYFLGYILG